VFVFASAYPFFGPVDEYRHVDVVHKYANGYRSGADDPLLDPEIAALMASWGSPEYVFRPERFRPGFQLPPPPAHDPNPQRARKVERLRELYEARESVDAHAPPVYYWLASRVYLVAHALGLDDLRAFYTVRWLNAAIAAALALAAGLALRCLVPHDALVYLGVPLFIACYPNDLWYGVTNDAALPLFGGAAFLLLALLPDERRTGHFAAAGLLVAAAVLTKYTAIGLLAVAFVAAAGDVGRARGTRRERTLRWLLASAAALVPIGAWLLRNRFVVGNWSGEASKAAFMTMTPRPLAAWPDHPLFGVRGWSEFLPHLAANFWTGEFSWYGEAQTRPWLDAVYAVTTGAVLLLAVASFWRERSQVPTPARRVLRLAFVAIAAGVATLALLSLAFDLETANFSTRWDAFPYFASGRLIAWILVPFGLVLVRGIAFACSALPSRWRRPAAWSLLVALLAFATLADAVLARPVFASAYNWFHL
jgi:hypothetical protein